MVRWDYKPRRIGLYFCKYGGIFSGITGIIAKEPGVSLLGFTASAVAEYLLSIADEERLERIVKSTQTPEQESGRDVI